MDQFAQVAIAILVCRRTPSAFVLGSAVGNISFQTSQILRLVAGAAVVAVVDPYQKLGLDVSFGVSPLLSSQGCG